jgi:phosphoenolpyruvate-protein kinase (PTS system EI component)
MMNYGISEELRNLERINSCFQDYFISQKQPLNKIKANIDSISAANSRYIKSVGLIRTEQLIAGNENQSTLTKKIILNGDSEHDELYRLMLTDYRELLYNNINKCFPCRIRLLDISPDELLNTEEQKEFILRYGTLNIHGKDAIEAWPEIYEAQIKTIFVRMNERNFENQNTPLEIMMPAIRTEEDILKIKKMIKEVAKENSCEDCNYKFGIMIETLDACRNIEEIINHVDFVSFGTNDLTKEFFDIKRNDLRAHARFEQNNGINPFKELAPEILDLIEETVEIIREIKPDTTIGICGAQAANTDTALQLFGAGIDDISVSPTMANLYALPTMINYRKYDSMKSKQADLDNKFTPES